MSVETYEKFKQRVHEAALARMREKHDKDGFFSKAPHHIWEVISQGVNWDKVAEVYVDRERCSVCGEERNHAWHPVEWG